VEVAPPQIFSIAGYLQLALHRDRTDEVKPQPLEGWILGRELTYGADRPPLEFPDIHAQHSPLT
jgi:hypothetical protein